MKYAMIAVLAASGLALGACDDGESDVVVIDRTEPAEEGDSTSFSIGEDGVSFSSTDSDGDGSSTSVSAGEGGLSVETRD